MNPIPAIIISIFGLTALAIAAGWLWKKIWTPPTPKPGEPQMMTFDIRIQKVGKQSRIRHSVRIRFHKYYPSKWFPLQNFNSKVEAIQMEQDLKKGKYSLNINGQNVSATWIRQ